MNLYLGLFGLDVFSLLVWSFWRIEVVIGYLCLGLLFRVCVHFTGLVIFWCF